MCYDVEEGELLGLGLAGREMGRSNTFFFFIYISLYFYFSLYTHIHVSSSSPVR